MRLLADPQSMTLNAYVKQVKAIVKRNKQLIPR